MSVRRCCRAGVLIVAHLTALLAAVALALRWVDSAAVPVVVVQSALVPVGALGGLAALVLLGMRRTMVGLVAAAVGAGYLALAVPAVSGHPSGAQGGDLVVLSLNLQYGRADTGQIARVVRQVDPDVIMLAEVTPQADAALAAAGLSGYRDASGLAMPGADGLIVRSRLPMASIDWGPDAEPPAASAVGRVRTSAGPVVVRAIHTFAPNPREAVRWRASMDEHTAWAQTRHRDVPVVMAGDFNSSFGHPAFRAVAAGYTDAHRAVGAGWVRTWPLGWSVPAWTALDHVLVRGMHVVDAGRFTVDGTDHAGLWARLRRD